VYILLTTASGCSTNTFMYELSDRVRRDRAVVTVHVVPYIAQEDEVTIGSGRPIAIHVAENDLGFGYSRTIGLVTSPQHGTAVVSYSYDPTIIYTSTPGFLGEDRFQYAIDDGTRIAIANVIVHVINDDDGDEIEDTVDNCLGLVNPDQRDADGDGYGSLCDADFNNDGRVNFQDLALFRASFATGDANADMDGSGAVNFADLARFRILFGKSPGPSALVSP